jgi:uncharacterized protein
MLKTRAWRAAYAVVLLGAAVTALAEPAELLDLATYPRAALDIVQRDPPPARRFHFDVWVADTPARAEQGLMYVRDLPPAGGMVFPFAPSHVVSFWMKNTYIPLDLLFIEDGRVVKITANAAPLKTDLLSSGVPVSAVLELRGGEAGLLGVKVGDRVSWKPAASPAAR